MSDDPFAFRSVWDLIGPLKPSAKLTDIVLAAGASVFELAFADSGVSFCTRGELAIMLPIGP
jgi:hypothetical protein